MKSIHQQKTMDKGHSRIEYRSYIHYDISAEHFDQRWEKSNFQSLFVVERERCNLQAEPLNQSIHYYISNGKYKPEEDYFTAIRDHWSVEVNHNIRDVSLKEDELKTKESDVSRCLASCRTLVIKLLKKTNAKNLIAQLELFQDNFLELLNWLRTINFL